MQKGKKLLSQGIQTALYPMTSFHLDFPVFCANARWVCWGGWWGLCMLLFKGICTKFLFPVVYEHRSRLEKSLQKERLEHKKAKEGKNVLFTLTFNLIIVESNFKWFFFNFK